MAGSVTCASDLPTQLRGPSAKGNQRLGASSPSENTRAFTRWFGPGQVYKWKCVQVEMRTARDWMGSMGRPWCQRQGRGAHVDCGLEADMLVDVAKTVERCWPSLGLVISIGCRGMRVDLRSKANHVALPDNPIMTPHNAMAGSATRAASCAPRLRGTLHIRDGDGQLSDLL